MKIKRMSAEPGTKFSEFLKADKQKQVMHPKASLRSSSSKQVRDGDRLMLKNKLNSRAVSAGHWQTFLEDRNLTAAERLQKIRETAQVMESKAIRMELKLQKIGEPAQRPT